jgi:hypothetical protein
MEIVCTMSSPRDVFPLVELDPQSCGGGLWPLGTHRHPPMPPHGWARN